MIYAANAVLFAWIASFWSKSGTLNMIIALTFTTFAVINAALSSPTIVKWIAP